MLEITVKTLDSQNHSFSCEDDITVHGFKEHIAETVSVPAESQRLIYRGRVLQDDKKLNDYGNVNGQVIHLVQRAPPQPESHSSNSDAQRQNNDQNSPRDGSRVQYLRHLHRNAMYLGAMSMPAEVVEGRGLPAPHLSNTLSNSRLIAARRMLNKAIQLMDRLDDPSVPLHPSPTESNAPEPPPQASAPEEEAEQDSTVNSNENNSGNRMVQAFSEMAAAFSAAALINIRLSHGNNEDGGSVSGSVNVIDASQLGESGQAQAREPEQETSSSQRLAQTASDVESERPNAERAEAERTETERNDASTSSNSESQNASQRSTPQVPRPPRMAELLDRLIITQSRLRTYIERYRSLMLADPILTPDDGPEGVAENQRIVNGVSECLHYLAHACHALSDIIVDMGQQPPRNLRCRPIIIQHSAILQAGIPIQVESHINLTRRNATNNNNNNATDEGNEATRPSSPTSASSDQNSRSNNASNRSIPQSANGQQNQPSILGTLFNLPSNVELSMELSPQSAMDISSPSAPDGAENDQSQSNNNNNNNGNAGGTNSVFSMSPTFALIRDALQSVLAVSERRSQIDTSNGTVINTPTNIPFVTIVGQQAMDLGSSNSGQSTQARSNIGTHPTTSTQTRSTARPHVLHPHTHPLNVGVGMGQSLDFDPFLPCNSHHIRRNPPATANATSTSQSNQANQSTTSESHTRSQSASHTSSTSTGNVPQSHSVNFTVGGDANVTRDLVENDGQALASGIGLVMSLNELLQSPGTSNIHFSVVDSGLNHGEIHLTPNSDIPLADLFTSLNVRLDEFADRNFLMNLGIFMLRNITIGGMVQLDQGQSGPLVNLRRPLREFLEHSFPNASQATLQERILEQIVSFNRPYLQAFIVPEEATNRRIDILATFESLIHKFCEEFLKLLFNNDLDNATFAQEAVTLAKKLENQFSAVLQYIFQGEQSTFEAAMTRFINHLTEDIPPFLQQTVQGDLSSRIRSYVTRTSSLSQEEIASLIIYKDEPSAPPAESESAQVPEEKKEPQVNSESRKQEQAQAQAQSQQPEQEPKQPAKKEKLDEATNDVKSEPMELELDSKAVNDPMDLANGEEIPETFPGAENIPAEWVPIIARDSVRQREQAQLEALQGGPIPFSDAYLSTMPSKRRKLIEQQKPQLLANPTPNGTAITASVERLVREGISHSQLQEAEGAAGAVAAVPAVRRAFGQAIKDSLHPGRLKTPDFPNTARFPNASKYFADAENKDEKEAAKPNTATTK